MTLSSIIMRGARLGDAAAIADLAKEFAEENPSSSRTAGHDLLQIADRVAALVESETYRVIVADLGGEVVGVVAYLAIPSIVHAGRSTLFIELLIVRRAQRRRGIGTLLVNQATRVAHEDSAYKVLLVTRENNIPAIGLYDKCGFSKNGIGLALYIET